MHEFNTNTNTDAMRAHRIGDAILRSNLSPLLPFLAPSVSSSTWASIYPRQYPSCGHLQASTNPRCLATKTTPMYASAATASKNDDEDLSQQSQRHSSQRGSDRHNVLQALTASVINSNSSKSRAKNLRDRPTYSATASSSAPRQTSANIFKFANENDKRSKAYRLDPRQGGIIEALKFPGSQDDTDVSVAQFKALIPAVPPPVRLDAFVGRSEEVDPDKGMDLGRALKKLEVKCTYNNVKGDVLSQRFHERPGIKRKRLKSQRWRKRFREGFRAVVAKVQDMRNRGW